MTSRGLETLAICNAKTPSSYNMTNVGVSDLWPDFVATKYWQAKGCASPNKIVVNKQYSSVLDIRVMLKHQCEMQIRFNLASHD